MKSLLILASFLLGFYVQVPPGPPPVAQPSIDPWNCPTHVLKEDGTLWYMGPGYE